MDFVFINFYIGEKKQVEKPKDLQSKRYNQ